MQMPSKTLTQPSLVPFIGLALLLHLIALLLIKVMPNQAMQIAKSPVLDVQLSAPMQSPSVNLVAPMELNATEIKPSEIKSEVKRFSPESLATNQQKIKKTTKRLEKSTSFNAMPDIEIAAGISAAPTQTPSTQTNEAAIEKPILTTEALLASARSIAIEAALAEEKNEHKAKREHIALADRAFSPELANTLTPRKKVNAGATQYANGMVKMVNADGSEYCLQQSPMLNKGAFENDPIPMTCP